MHVSSRQYACRCRRRRRRCADRGDGDVGLRMVRSRARVVDQCDQWRVGKRHGCGRSLDRGKQRPRTSGVRHDCRPDDHRDAAGIRFSRSLAGPAAEPGASTATKPAPPPPPSPRATESGTTEPGTADPAPPSPAPPTPATADATAPPSPAPQDPVEVDGRVSSLRGSCPNLTFVISGMTISADGSTEYRAGNCKHVEEGLRVLVVGHRQSEGRVRAERIDLKPKD